MKYYPAANNSKYNVQVLFSSFYGAQKGQINGYVKHYPKCDFNRLDFEF